MSIIVLAVVMLDVEIHVKEIVRKHRLPKM